MQRRMRSTALVSLTVAVFLSAGCSKVERTPIDEANYLLSHDKVDAAIQAANQALADATTPEEKSDAYTLIGRCQLTLAIDAKAADNLHANQQALDDAIEAFTISIETLDNFNARYGRRTAYKKTGKENLALEDYVAARKLDPDYRASRINEKPEEIRDYLDLDVKHLEDEKQQTGQTNSSATQDTTEDWQIENKQEEGAPDTFGERTRLQSNRKKTSPEGRPTGVTADTIPNSAKSSDNTNSADWFGKRPQQNSALSPPSSQAGATESPSPKDTGKKDTGKKDTGKSDSGRDGPKEPPQEKPQQVGNRGGWPGSGFPLIGPSAPTMGLPTTGAPTTGLPIAPPTTGLPTAGPLPTTGYGLLPHLPQAGVPTTGIGGSFMPNMSRGGAAGISPANPTTGIGTARVGLPTGLPANSTWPAAVLPAVPTFRHGVSLPRSGADATQPYRVPSAGIPDDLAPRPFPPTFGPNPAKRRGATQFGTSPLSQPIPGQSIRSTPGSLVPPSQN